ASKIFLPPALGFFLLLTNSTVVLFVGTIRTPPAFFLTLPALFVFASFAIVGLQMVRRTTNRTNDLVVAMLVAPVALILFGFLRGLDPSGLLFVYRAFDFMDYAFAVLVGVAFTASWKVLRVSRASRGALLAGFVVALLSTTPMAWNTPEVFGVQNVTTSDEFQALALLGSLGARNVTTDQRMADVGRMWFGYVAHPDLPQKLQDHASLAGAGYALVLERWPTIGGQIHPAPTIVLAPESLAAVRGTS